MGKDRHLDSYYLEGIKNGDDTALSALYKTFFPMIEHLILNNSGTEQEAKDIYQEAIISFYEKLTKGSLELNCSIKTFLYSICRRLWLKRLSEKSRLKGKLDDLEEFIEVENEVDDIIEGEKKHLAMKNALGYLGEPCRTIIEDFYIGGLTMDAITEKFGYTNADNAKNQKYKCLQRLKKIFFTDYKIIR